MNIDQRAQARAKAERHLREGVLLRKEIAARCGINPATLRKWVQRYGWERAAAPASVAGQGAPASPPKADPAKPEAKRKAGPRKVSRTTLVRRLYIAIDRNLQALEQRMNDDATPSAADGERDARALGAAIRNIEKVTELEAGTVRDADTARERGRGFAREDADRLRLELAERILRLRRQRGDVA